MLKFKPSKKIIISSALVVAILALSLSVFSQYFQADTAPPPPANASSGSNFDQYGRILTGGQPFFPLGWYSDANTAPRMTARLDGIAAANSFNTVLCEDCFSNDVSAYLNYANQKGLKIILKTYGQVGQTFRDSVNNYKNSPAMLGWNIAEEYPTDQAADAKANYDYVKANDPGHLAMIVDWENYSTFAGAADYFGVEAYPVLRNLPIGNVTKYINEMKTSGASRPFIAVLEGSTQKNWIAGRENKDTCEEQYNYHCSSPTHDQVLNESYQAIIAGARGIIYYGLNQLLNEGTPQYSFSDPQWAVMKTVGTDVMKVKDIALGIDAPANKSVTSSDPKVKVLTRQVGNDYYVIVANTAQVVNDNGFGGAYQTANSTFTIGSGLTISDVTVGVPGTSTGTLTVSANKFSESLPALAVRVYKLNIATAPPTTPPSTPPTETPPVTTPSTTPAIANESSKNSTSSSSATTNSSNANSEAKKASSTTQPALFTPSTPVTVAPLANSDYSQSEIVFSKTKIYSNDEDKLTISIVLKDSNGQIITSKQPVITIDGMKSNFAPPVLKGNTWFFDITSAYAGARLVSVSLDDKLIANPTSVEFVAQPVVPEKKSSNKVLIIISLVIGLAILAATYFYFRKKRNSIQFDF